MQIAWSKMQLKSDSLLNWLKWNSAVTCNTGLLDLSCHSLKVLTTMVWLQIKIPNANDYFFFFLDVGIKRRDMMHKTFKKSHFWYFLFCLYIYYSFCKYKLIMIFLLYCICKFFVFLFLVFCLKCSVTFVLYLYLNLFFIGWPHLV